MDPITTALVAAVGAGVASGVTKVGKQSIVDAYSGLKKIINDKFGKKAELTEAVKKIESKPDSKGHQMVLAEEVENSLVHKDPEILKAAQTLMQALQSTPEGRQVVAKYQVNVEDSQVGIIGDGAKVKGGIHFGGENK